MIFMEDFRFPCSSSSISTIIMADRQTDKKTRVAFFRVINLRSEGQSGHYCVCHGTTCHETHFLFVELLLPQSCNYINEGEVSELDLIQVLDLQCSGSIS